MKTVIAAAATLFAAMLLAAAPAAAYRYVTIDAPVPVLGTLVSSVNDHGVATGYYVEPDGVGGPGIYTAFTVNADGSGFTSFTRPGYAQTGASGINDAGDITGVSVTAAGQGAGFVRSGADGSYADIVPTFAGAYYSEAIGINDTGAVTGYYVTDPAATVATLTQYAHGFIEVGGAYTAVDVDPSLGYGTQVVSINDLGVFTGSYFDNSPGHFTHPFVGQFDPASGTATITAYPPEPFGLPASTIGNITDNGLTTYDLLTPFPYSPDGYAAVAFVVDIAHGGLTPVSVPGSAFTNAFGVNAAGQVTGFFLDRTGIHGFIGSAVPEPAAWSLMIAGFGVVGAALRRRTVAAVRG